MTSPYRNEIDALRERKDSLEREIARLKEQTSHLDGLRAREQDLERELAAVAQRLGASTGKRSLPMLDQVRIASPCNASWDEMLGDERVRFCVSCEKNVYNLSAMPREDAERLLQERVGKELCVRFYQRADGTILTEDCPVGVKKKRRKKLALAVAGAGAMAFAATSMLTRGLCATQGSPEPFVMGEMGLPPEMVQQVDPAPPVPPVGGWQTGDRAVEPVPSSTPPVHVEPSGTAQPMRPLMGAPVAIPPPPVKGNVTGKRMR
ncbi:MAG: hypothetical protein BGO98_05570 [Myxococcales bacterium 68-20]|nr:MAG: hypothetical protein BGO98_05570 [Myxococcales bacterium 68-20]